jgi:hypothetical protein
MSENIISDWLKENGNPEIEIKVLNEVIDKLLEEREISYSKEEVLKLCYGFSIFVLQNKPSHKKQEECFKEFLKLK